MDWSIFRRLTLHWRTFTPVERIILDAVAESVPVEMQPKIRRQIESINLVQRILDWTEINLYCDHLGKVRWPAEAKFDNDGEFELAKASYSVAGRDFETTIWCVGGHIFSLITRPSIKPYCFADVSDMSVRIIGDPRAAGPGSPDLTQFHPESYLSFVEDRSTDAPINGWWVRKPGDTHVVHVAAGDFVVLAERDRSEWLLSRKDSSANSIYRCLTDREPEKLSVDFATAVLG